MTNQELQNLILADTQRMVEAMTTGAAYEIWMQVELIVLLRQAKVPQVARELPYPSPNGTLKLDAAMQINAVIYAMELKVESPTNAGTAILSLVKADIAKIKLYNAAVKWVIGIGYSGVANNALQQFAADPSNHSIFAVSNSIGVLIATA